MPVRLPDAITACLFDLDGVLTDTAKVRAKAWKQMFDGCLRAEPSGQAPFDAVRHCDEHVDGRPRSDGVRSFLTHAAVFEDTLVGVEAGCAGGFATVVGVDQVGQAAALREHGAAVVVEALAELVEPG